MKFSSPKFSLSSTPAPDAPSVSPETGGGVVPLADLLRQNVPSTPAVPVREIGGRRDGPEPTRYGDWEKNGRCIDF